MRRFVSTCHHLAALASTCVHVCVCVRARVRVCMCICVCVSAPLSIVLAFFFAQTTATTRINFQAMAVVCCFHRLCFFAFWKIVSAPVFFCLVSYCCCLLLQQSRAHMCIHTLTRARTHTHTHIYTYTHARAHAHIHTRIHARAS